MRDTDTASGHMETTPLLLAHEGVEEVEKHVLNSIKIPSSSLLHVREVDEEWWP